MKMRRLVFTVLMVSMLAVGVWVALRGHDGDGERKNGRLPKYVQSRKTQRENAAAEAETRVASRLTADEYADLKGRMQTIRDGWQSPATKALVIGPNNTNAYAREVAARLGFSPETKDLLETARAQGRKHLLDQLDAVYGRMLATPANTEARRQLVESGLAEAAWYQFAGQGCGAEECATLAERVKDPALRKELELGWNLARAPGEPAAAALATAALLGRRRGIAHGRRS